MRPHRISALAALVLVASAGLGLWLTLPVPSGAQPGLSELRSQADRQRGRERSLESGVARLSALVRRVESQLAIVERRRAQVQAELDSDQAKLDRLQSELREQRIRLTRLRARLAEARMILSGRLVALYKAPQPDLVSIVLESQGWGDLVERTAFQKRIRRQDNRIILTVRRARREAGSAVKRLTRDEARQQRVTEAVQARRDAVASISQAIAGRRAVLVEARAARSAALSSARADRQDIEQRITKLEDEQVRFTSSRGPGGPWAIPWPIVQCESGGQNFPPNWAGASGFYQIIPATWKGFGGSGPAAYLASKAEQDRVATRIWNGGAGARNWDCFAIVNGR